jgi:Ca2+-binding EF-hand superfamily protein
MQMIKQLKAIATMGAMAAALMAATPASAETFPERIWSPAMMTAMDKNKDGVVTRQEYLDYMGAQFDIMDTKKAGRLTKSEFTDKKMMQSTFPNIPNIIAGG